MKKTELKEIKSLTIKDLSKKISDSKRQLQHLVISKGSSGGAKESRDVKKTFKKRKDIAQMMTILRQKQLLEELATTSEGPARSADGSPVETPMKPEVNSNENTSEVSEVKSRKSKAKNQEESKA